MLKSLRATKVINSAAKVANIRAVLAAKVVKTRAVLATEVVDAELCSRQGLSCAQTSSCARSLSSVLEPCSSI